MSSSRVERILDKGLGWATLVVGVLVIAGFRIAGASQPGVAQAAHPSAQDLVGLPVRLPQHDVTGAPLPPMGAFYVTTVTCGGCARPEEGFRLLRNSPLKPVIVAVAGTKDDIDPVYLSDPESVRVISDSTGRYVPLNMIKNAPVLAYVSARGQIVAVSRGEERPDEFFKRSRAE